MTLVGVLFISTLALPLALAIACVWLSPARSLSLLPFAAMPGLLAAIFSPSDTLVLAPAPMRLTLALDVPGALLLGGASLLWTFAGLYARRYMREDSRARSFAIGWLMTLAGSLGVFIVADLASFYMVFALVSLSAYGLVAHEKTPGATRAGLIYMVLAIAGEAFLLLAFVMMANGHDGNPLIAEAVAGLSASPWRDEIIALLIIGFGLKMGLVPVHVWMPLAHPVAPMPASAVLSGIVVKAGVIGLIRFLPLDAGMPFWGGVLTVVGLGTAFYAVAVGIVQKHPKTVLAYSTVSQMGFIATVLGAGLAAGDVSTGPIAAYYALHHMLVKGALFLGVGVAATMGKGRFLTVILPCTVLSLSLAGLPFTSGALAKFAAKSLMGDGLAATLATLSATGSALLMLHFMHLLSGYGKPKPDATSPLGLVVPWAAVALCSIAVPFVLFDPVTGYTLSAAFGASELWKAILPIMLGVALTALLRRCGRLLPAVPEGDIVVIAEAAAPSFVRFSDALAQADVFLRRWPIAGIALTVIALALGIALRRAP